MSLEKIEKQMTPMLNELSSLDATIKFECKGDGIIFVDATECPALLSHDDEMADCTIKISAKNLEKLLAGKLDPMLAFTLGKLKVKGAMGTAMKLTSLLN